MDLLQGRGVWIFRKEEGVQITGKEESTRTHGEEDPIKEIEEWEKRARTGMGEGMVKLLELVWLGI